MTNHEYLILGGLAALAAILYFTTKKAVAAVMPTAGTVAPTSGFVTGGGQASLLSQVGTYFSKPEAAIRLGGGYTGILS